jgi:hypothetical protein
MNSSLKHVDVILNTETMEMTEVEVVFQNFPHLSRYT